jgi:hypothetical protein
VRTGTLEAAAVLPDEARRDGDDLESLLANTLGEGQFGPGHWQLSSAKRAYYMVKPLLPRAATSVMRRLYGRSTERSFSLNWPVEDRYARFQWEVLRCLARRLGVTEVPFIDFWPHGHGFAFVITHDIETLAGQAQALALAELDARYGFRSSFNFVAERYALDRGLMEELRQRGFEVGVHGLKHDGKLFSSRSVFDARAGRINHYLKDFGAAGFRAPLTHRNPEWMQSLEVEYDLSFFDTDPFEAIPGGTMSIWPYHLGRFVELPYTLAQDYTLTAILHETSPRLWREKVDFIEGYHGMALINTHPDYLGRRDTARIYEEFLASMSTRSGLWNAPPREVAAWWRKRSTVETLQSLPGGTQASLVT